MATSAYKYKNFETLVMIANQFNTDVSTLVRLNTWLRDPNSGKTHINPNISTTNQILDISESKSLAFAFTVKPKKGSVKAKAITLDDQVINYYSDDNMLISKSTDMTILGKIDYDRSVFIFEDALNRFKSVVLIYDQEYWPTYIVLPLISNGQSSIEDYWQNMTQATGINYDELLNDYVSSQSFKNQSKSLDDLDVDYSNGSLDLNYPSSMTLDKINFESSNLGGPSRVSTMFAVEELKSTINMNRPDKILDNSEEGIFDTGFISKSENSPGLNAVDIDTAKFINKLNSIIGNSTTDNIKCQKLKYKELKFDAYSNTKMIIQVGDNIIYLPVVPDSISDAVSANYSSEQVLGSSEPYTIYNSTSPRALQFQITLHRDMSTSKDDNILETIAGIIQSGVYPSYANSEVAALNTKVKVLNQVYISGIMLDASVEFSGPIRAKVSKSGSSDWMTGKYTVLTISFKVQEVNTSPKKSSDILNRWSKLESPDSFKNAANTGLSTSLK